MPPRPHERSGWNSPPTLGGAAGLLRDPVDRTIGVYAGDRAYRFDNVEVMPVAAFFRALHRGEIF